MTTGLPDSVALERARLALEIEGAVATVTLSCPERRNSQTPAMWHALDAIGSALPDEVRVVVLKGASASFSAGLDVGLLSPDGLEGEESVAELMHGSDEQILAAIDGYQRGFTWLRDPRFVTIAQVH